MDPISLAELKRIKWVQDVEKVGTGYRVKTRKGSLKTTLTHNITDMGDGYGSSYDNRYRVGTVLPEPVSLKLPQYYIHLKSMGFDFTFAKYPGDRTQDRIGFTPTYQATYLKSQWERMQGVCYGSSDQQADGTGRSVHDEYCNAKSWRDRLVIAAMYLQSAEPHYGLTWYRTSYAVRLGLVGSEYVTISPDIERRRIQAEECRKRVEEQARQRVLATEEQVRQLEALQAQQQNNTTAMTAPRGFIWTGFLRGNN